MKQDTLEGRAKTKNGVKRLCFSAVCILLEAAFIIAMITKLNQYAEIINLITRLLAGVLVLKLYASDQTSSMKMPWVILILVFPILGVGLYLLIGLNGGTRKMRERYDQIDRELLPLLPNDSECRETLGRKIPKAGNISDYIQKNASYPVYQNTDVIYYDEAVKGLEAQLADLAKAEKFIFMEYHAIEDAQAWHKIQRVLEDRVKAGVEVRVFYDDMGSIGFINTDFIKKMENVGIHCRVFNPFTPGLNVFLNNRDHRKICVIDGHTGFTGGINLADEYINAYEKHGHWKDTAVLLPGEAVQGLTEMFLELWQFTCHETLELQDFLPTERRTCSGYVQPYGDSPLDSCNLAEHVYMQILNHARRYVYITTPYLILDNEMLTAICLAAQSGVDVRIITPYVPDKWYVHMVTRSHYKQLLEAGVRIFEYTPGFIHAKQCVCDGETAVVGTINLDYRSLYLHFENGVFLYDCEAIKDIKADFDGLFPICQEVTEEYRSGRSAVLRIGQCILRLAAPLL